MTDTASKNWPEDDLVLISALEHWRYCPRQCALIHVERTFDDPAQEFDSLLCITYAHVNVPTEMSSTGLGNQCIR